MYIWEEYLFTTSRLSNVKNAPYCEVVDFSSMTLMATIVQGPRFLTRVQIFQILLSMVTNPMVSSN